MVSLYRDIKPKGLAGELPGPNWLSKLLDLTRFIDSLTERLLSVDSPPAQDLPPAAQYLPPAGQGLPPAGQDVPPAGQDVPPAGQDPPPAAHDPPSETSMDFSVLKYDFNENGDLIKQI
ncbi:hypothetical protein ACLKA6_018890 [Drosophila palustris]